MASTAVVPSARPASDTVEVEYLLDRNSRAMAELMQLAKLTPEQRSTGNNDVIIREEKLRLMLARNLRRLCAWADQTPLEKRQSKERGRTLRPISNKRDRNWRQRREYGTRLGHFLSPTYRNVTYYRGRYRARVTYKCKDYFVGMFNKEAEAGAAVEEANRQLQETGFLTMRSFDTNPRREQTLYLEGDVPPGQLEGGYAAGAYGYAQAAMHNQYQLQQQQVYAAHAGAAPYAAQATRETRGAATRRSARQQRGARGGVVPTESVGCQASPYGPTGDGFSDYPYDNPASTYTTGTVDKAVLALVESGPGSLKAEEGMSEEESAEMQQRAMQAVLPTLPPHVVQALQEEAERRHRTDVTAGAIYEGDEGAAGGGNAEYDAGGGSDGSVNMEDLILHAAEQAADEAMASMGSGGAGNMTRDMVQALAHAAARAAVEASMATGGNP